MQHTAISIGIKNDEARAAMQSVSNGTATSADYSVVRSYLRTPEGKQQASRAVEQLDKSAIKAAAQTLQPETARVFDELYAAHVDSMREELYATSATAAERQIVDQVISGYVRLQLAQRRYDDATDRDSMRFWDKQLTGALRRYLCCIESLCRVRRYELQLTERRDADGSQQRTVSLRASS